MWKKVTLAIALLALVGVLAAGAMFLLVPSDETLVTQKSARDDVLQKEAPLTALDAQTVETAQGLVFDVGLEDFIQSYNGYFWQAQGKRYLRPAEDWQKTTVAQTVERAQPQTCYTFTADPDVWTLPQINVYVPEGGTHIVQVDLNYDEHSYSPATYALYEEVCFYTLKTFFPDLSDGALKNLYETLNQLAYDNTFPSSAQYRPGTARLPVALYHRDGIGVFTYFAIGAPLHFSVIPVDQALLESYAASGVDVQTVA